MEGWRERHSSFCFVVVATTLLAAPTAATAETTLPPTVVRGQSPGAVLCEGSACEHIINELFGWNEFITEMPPILEPDAFSQAQKDRICRELKQARPPNCSTSIAPSTPRHDSNWQSNGCGDGSWIANLANAVVDLNHPVPGVSFYGACMNHDRCYGLAQPQAQCDNTFQQSLNAACGTSISTYQAQCGTWSNVISQAVISGGSQAHQNAVRQLDCASWHKDMEKFTCPK